MPPPISDDIRWSIVNLLQVDLHLTQAQIATEAGVSIATVERVQSNLSHYGQPTIPEWVKSSAGRPSTLSEDMGTFILDYIDGCPHALAQEVAAEVEFEFDTEVSAASIYRFLKKQSYTRKVAVRVAQEQNPLLREAWRLRMVSYHPRQLICIDESASNEKTGWRKYAWAPRGFSATYVGSIKRTVRWSILPALSYDGYIGTPLVVHGSITREILLEWLQNDVLPFCNPYSEEEPTERSVIVLDNASIHRGLEIRELCDAWGVKLEYLPPYSPDYNPIELTFNTLKSWIRRNFEKHSIFDSWEDFIYFALEQSGCSVAAPAYYEHAGMSAELYEGNGDFDD